MTLSRRQIINAEGCEVIYIPNFFSKQDSRVLLQYFASLDTFERAIVTMKDKSIPLPRQTCCFGDKGLVYRNYSGLIESPGWPDFNPLLEQKERIEQESLSDGQKFNFLMVNKYADGNEYIGYHQDVEPGLVKESVIASVSLGVARDFCFKHLKTKEVIKLSLEHGSLLLMKGKTQQVFSHSLPKRLGVTVPRYNLTFRISQ